MNSKNSGSKLDINQSLTVFYDKMFLQIFCYKNKKICIF